MKFDDLKESADTTISTVYTSVSFVTLYCECMMSTSLLDIFGSFQACFCYGMYGNDMLAVTLHTFKHMTCAIILSHEYLPQSIVYMNQNL